MKYIFTTLFFGLYATCFGDIKADTIPNWTIKYGAAIVLNGHANQDIGELLNAEIKLERKELKELKLIIFYDTQDSITSELEIDITLPPDTDYDIGLINESFKGLTSANSYIIPFVELLTDKKLKEFSIRLYYNDSKFFTDKTFIGQIKIMR